MIRKIRILHLVQNLNFGGMERIIAELARRTDSAHFDTHVMALQYIGHFGDRIKETATLHLSPPMGQLSMLSPTVLARQITEIDPDIVHIHSGVWYKGSLAARMAGVPSVLYTDHGRQNPDPLMYRFLDNIAARRTDVTVAVSAPLKDVLSRFLPRNTDIRIVKNGVDTDIYIPPANSPSADSSKLRSELKLSSVTPVIGTVGRLEPIKGYDVMIEAMGELRQLYNQDAAQRSGPFPHLAIVGDGSQRKKLEQRTHQLGIQNSVTFLGWRDDIQAILPEFDVFSMSSHSEGTSVSLLEAMSVAVCPVVTNVGGNSEVLGEDLQHRLVPPASPLELAQAWQRALAHTEKRVKDAIAARERVVSVYSLDAMVLNYQDLYRQLFHRHQEWRERREQVAELDSRLQHRAR